MSKKNERYYKGRRVDVDVGQHEKSSNVQSINKGVVDLRPSRFHVELKGQEVTIKEKKPLLKRMPEKPLNIKPKLQPFPIMKKLNKKEKLASIKIRLLLLKLVYKWEQKAFGRVSPAKARQYYHQRLLKKSFQQWEDAWWNGRNEWKLNIRADYHNRFRMWLKVWGGWHSFLILQKVKKTKMNLAKKKADHMLLTKSFASWKTYVGRRQEKKEFHLRAQEDGKIILKRMAFSKWKTCLKFKQELYAMDAQALHFWAHNIFHKTWQRWLLEYSCALNEKKRIIFAIQLYNRRLARKIMCSFKLYMMRRKLKNLRLLSGIRFHRLQKLRSVFLKWKMTWIRKVEKDINLCRVKRRNECKALHRYQTIVKLKCMKALQKRIEIRKRTALFHVMATKFHKTTLMRRIWTSWLTACDSREDLRQIRLIKFVESHYRMHLLIKVFHCWTFYCGQRRYKHNQKLKADVAARRNMLPRFFSRWQVFVDLVKTRRLDQERAEEFRRECLFAKTFYCWLQEYRLALDIQMLYRMAIISYDQKVKKGFFQLWLTKTRRQTRENYLMERGHDHYQHQLKMKCFVTWRKYMKCLSYRSVRLNMAVRHQNTKLLSVCWRCWTKFVAKKREKWKLVIKADLHFRQRIFSKSVQMWKLYCHNMKEIKMIAEEKKTSRNKKTLRFLLGCWRKNARHLRITRQKYHMSSRHWEIKTTRRAFFAWRDYAEDRLWKKQKKLSRMIDVKKLLDQGKLRRTLHLWRRKYLSNISFREKWSRATEHWKSCVLRKTFDFLKKYRFLGYRKQVLRQHCMLYHNERIVASHWEIWRSRVFEEIPCGTLVVEFNLATEDKRKKKNAINEALQRRRQWLHKVAVIQWIKFATYSIAQREKFAVSRHVQISRSIQRSVQRCAIHWRRKTIRNRGKRRDVASLNQHLSDNTSRISQKTGNKGNTSKSLISRSFVQSVPAVKRPQPRVPDYLRESFNLSAISEQIISSSIADAEDIPRNLPPNIQPVSKPERLPEPTVYTSSATSRTSSDASQTSSKEVMLVKVSSQNSKKKSWKVGSCEKPLLLPPSCFVRTSKRGLENGPGFQSTQAHQKGTKGRDKKKGDISSCQEIQNGSQSADAARSDIKPASDAISAILSDKNSQQSIVQLRDRMLKYYTITTHLRDLRRRLTNLPQWSRESDENDATQLNEEELSLVKELVSELSENVAITSDNLEQCYQTMTNDLQELLDKTS